MAMDPPAHASATTRVDGDNTHVKRYKGGGSRMTMIGRSLLPWPTVCL